MKNHVSVYFKMKKINNLKNICKGEVSLVINEHRNNYFTVEDWLEELDIQGVPPEVMEEMCKRDVVVDLWFYPDTPVGFYRVLHYDVEAAVDIALNILEASVEKIQEQV